MRLNDSMSQKHRFPALALWHDELRAGVRTANTFDTLYGAACASVNGTERVKKRFEYMIIRSR